jgi:uncharacterized protein
MIWEKLWIQSLEGRAIDLINPDLSEYTIEEAAHSIARINRFTGHTDTQDGYSVAQHCCLVAVHLPEQWQYDGLVHDLHESIIGDISSPVKWAIEYLGGGDALHRLDTMHMDAIAKRWPSPHGPLSREGHAAVVEADRRALMTENRDLRGGKQARPWAIDVKPYDDCHVVPWSASLAEATYLDWFDRLGGVR